MTLVINGLFLASTGHLLLETMARRAAFFGQHNRGNSLQEENPAAADREEATGELDQPVVEERRRRRAQVRKQKRTPNLSSESSSDKLLHFMNKSLFISG